MDQSLNIAPGITPPPELVQQWMDAPHGLGLGCHPARSVPDATYAERLIEAAQWGADQELEACCEWLEQNQGRWEIPMALRDARRPKPPSLKEQALQELEQLRGDANSMGMGFDAPAIRRALEQLDD
jgi:hypothetical protein